MRYIIVLILVLSSFKVTSQTAYNGFLGKFPVSFVFNYSDSGLYVYNKYDTPIRISGKLDKTKMIFNEYHNNDISAHIIFDNYSKEADSLIGLWISSDSTKTYKINLKKEFEVTNGNDNAWLSNKELLQLSSTKKHYFKTVLTKENDDYYERVSSVKVFEKRTDRLIQEIDVEAESIGINNIEIGDYNFDNVIDFSLFEASYAGPNTTSLYFIFDTNKKKYLLSEISGISLEFNKKTKRIFERNSCCAGSSVTTAEYRLENNKMILIEEHCYKWDDNKQKIIEQEIKNCY